ncbi:hypothetical protein GALL_552960 [mine drainage metagenome]|uniref:Uncharacterized protein n=1 Tax=mine drainage metagenome TaxID=410659 RepID=A0A1J5PD55_9ZZZZ
MNYAELDKAAQAGFEAYATGKRMPAWVLKEQILADAWSVGRRQAEDKARSTCPKTMNQHPIDKGEMPC